MAPNILAVAEELGVDRDDFRKWVCMHEETHWVQFTANPWLRDHLVEQARELALDLAPDPERLRTELRGLAALLADRQLVQERLVGGVGDVVRVVGGLLAGHEGRVVRVKPNRWVLVVEVSFLGARVDVDLDERDLEKVV